MKDHGKNLVKETAMKKNQILVKKMEDLKIVLNHSVDKMSKASDSRTVVMITMTMVSQFLLFYRTDAVAMREAVTFLK
jgi:hypothetical protein